MCLETCGGRTATNRYLVRKPWPSIVPHVRVCHLLALGWNQNERLKRHKRSQVLVLFPCVVLSVEIYICVRFFIDIVSMWTTQLKVSLRKRSFLWRKRNAWRHNRMKLSSSSNLRIFSCATKTSRRNMASNSATNCQLRYYNTFNWFWLRPNRVFNINKHHRFSVSFGWRYCIRGVFYSRH